MANLSISVHFKMPRSQYIHKSMLLRGVKMPPPALNLADIEATKGRAYNSGRSYGGAPLRNDHYNGRGRGGRIDYADARPYPYPPQVNPGFAPQAALGNYHPPPMRGWAQPPSGPSPPYGNPPYGYPQPPGNFAYAQAPAPPPPHNYQNSYHDGNHRNQNPSTNYQGPITDGRYSGQTERNGM